MDTETVLKIIKVMENRLTHDDMNLDYATDENPDFWEGMPEYNFQLGYHRAFYELKNYLEFFIESQVNQAENDMNRGE